MAEKEAPPPASNLTPALAELERELLAGTQQPPVAAAPPASLVASPGAPSAASSSTPAAAHAASSGDAEAHAPAKASALKLPKLKIDLSGLRARVSAQLGGLKTQSSEVLGHLGSQDRPTRRMSLLFVLSLVGVIAVGALSVRRYVAYRRSLGPSAAELAEEARVLEELNQKNLDETRRRSGVLTLGSFTVEVRSPAAAGDSALSSAEIELVVECDGPETKAYIEPRLDQVKSEITDVLVPMGRDELLSTLGKKKLRKKVLERLNHWLPRGKIEDVFISRLLLT